MSVHCIKSELIQSSEPGNHEEQRPENFEASHPCQYKKVRGGEAQEKQSSKLATDNIPHKTAQKLRSRKKYIIKVLEYPGDRA